MSASGRAVIVVTMAALLLAVGATPAAAHAVGGAQASNYQTRILSVQPVVPGLTVEVADAGARLRVRNHTGREVTVLGYAGEPYLRVGPAGVFENRRSPATYLNRARINPAPPPPRRQRRRAAAVAPHRRRRHRHLARPPRPLDGRQRPTRG
jgi:hypothetical protein